MWATESVVKHPAKNLHAMYVHKMYNVLYLPGQQIDMFTRNEFIKNNNK
jgi:hypothetical protein